VSFSNTKSENDFVVGFTNQLPVAFREGCRGQTAHPKEMMLALCTSFKDLILLKNYFPIILIFGF
jgi:hypothetical protein